MKCYKAYFAWALIATAVFIVLNIDTMWSWSVDLAHHYALTFRISERWILLTSDDPTLGEMNIYPKTSHIFAAIIGALVGSPFLGVQLTVLLSVALLWLCFVYMLIGLPKPLNTVALFVALIVFYVNYFLFEFQLHGYEIVGNFFYSQLVGQALLVLSLILAMSVERAKGDLWAIIVFVPLMVIVAAFHLLPALELFGVFGGLIAIYAYDRYKLSFDRLKTTIISFAAFLIGLLTIFAHPSFKAMRAISENNGALELTKINYPFGLIALCLLVFAASAIIFIRWKKYYEQKKYLVLKYFALYGAATSVLCLLQYGLVYFGNGSDYAVKKYGFALTTIMYLDLSLILSMLFIGTKAFGVVYLNRLGSLCNSVLIFALSISLLFISLPSVKSLDVSDLVDIEKKLVYLFGTSIPSSGNDKSNVVIGLDRLPNAINYMYSIAIAHTPRDKAIPDVLIHNSLSQPGDYSFIVSSSLNNKYGAVGCKSLSSGDISIIDSGCFADRLVNSSKCSSSFDFTEAGDAPNILLSGFSGAEPHGRWTDGPTASFRCFSDRNVFKTAKLEITPFVFSVLNSQRLQIFVNGKGVYEGVLTDARSSANPLVIDLTGVPSAESYTFTFKMPDAASPKDVGFNDDRRKLGFSLKKLSFD